MPRTPTGQVYESSGKWIARLTHPDGQRPRYVIGDVTEVTEDEARLLARRMAERVREGNHAHAAKSVGAAGPIVTVEQLGEAWISGELFRRFGPINRLREKAIEPATVSRLRQHVFPTIGPRPVAAVTDRDVERCLAAIPPAVGAATRQGVHSALARIFGLAIVPCRLRADSPVSAYLRPEAGPPSLFGYLFPRELLALLRCPTVPLGRRVAYALAVYTGLRSKTLWAIRWRDLSLDDYTLLVRVTKNGAPQFVPIDAGLAGLLRAWRSGAEDTAAVVRDVKVGRRNIAAALRTDLQAAGIARPELFETEGAVRQLRFHDLRATFATWAMRAGWTEGRIRDRVGHLDGATISRYQRAARSLEDLRIEPFPSLGEAVPELVPPPAPAGKRPPEKATRAKTPVKKRGGDSRRGASQCPP